MRVAPRMAFSLRELFFFEIIGVVPRVLNDVLLCLKAWCAINCPGLAVDLEVVHGDVPQAECDEKKGEQHGEDRGTGGSSLLGNDRGEVQTDSKLQQGEQVRTRNSPNPLLHSQQEPWPDIPEATGWISG